MKSSRISVVVPVHDGGRYLAAAIRSVLDQTLPPAEVIVVDDGSTDDSAAVARSFAPAVVVVTQSRLGPAAARNAGVANASGDLLAFLDSDDLWLPDKLARQALALRDDPDCEAVFGGVTNFVSPELDEEQRLALAPSAGLTGSHHVGALLIRGEAFRRVGDFDPVRRHGEFIEWWGRAMRLGIRSVVLSGPVMRRRLHAGNMTRRERAGRFEYLSILREQLALRSAGTGRSREVPR